MKTVFSNRMTPHVWAQQSQSEGRNSNDTLFFEGATIYSYNRGFPIATFRKEGLFFTSRTYSATTARHVSLARQAVNTCDITFFIANPLADTRRAHEENYRAIMEECKALLSKLPNARQRKQKYIEAAQRYAASAYAYSKLFKLGHRAFEINETTLTKITEVERKAYIKRQKIIATRQEEQEREALLKMESWQRFELARAPYVPSGKVFMRVDLAKSVIETSQGATFPTGDAIIAFKQIALVRKHKLELDPCTFRGGSYAKLGHFRIDKVTPEGNVTAGCHFVAWDQIEYCAKILGLA